MYKPIVTDNFDAAVGVIEALLNCGYQTCIEKINDEYEITYGVYEGESYDYHA